MHGTAHGKYSMLCGGLFVAGLACAQPPPPGASDADEGHGGELEGGSESAELGDESETGGDGPSELDETLYPLVDGASWTYVNKTTSGQLLGMDIVEAQEIEWDGAQAWLLVDNPNEQGEWTQSVIVRDGEIAARVHKQIETTSGVLSLVDYDPGFLRANDAWDTVGLSHESAYERTETDGDGQNPDVEPRAHIYTVLAVDEAVTVAAGTFDCVKVERVRSVGANAGERVLFWFARGVGKVREERPAEGKVEELVSVAIPGGVELP